MEEGGVASSARSVLVVDDEVEHLRRALVHTLRPWRVELADSALVALGDLSRRKYTALVADFLMDPMDGLELCRRAQTIGRCRFAVLWSGHVSEATRRRALRAGVHAILPKTGDLCDLRDQLDRLAELVEAAGPRDSVPPDSASSNLAALLDIRGVGARLLYELELGRVDGRARSAAHLVQRVWGQSGNRHRLDVALGRLRGQLEGTGWSIPHPDDDGYRLRRSASALAAPACSPAASPCRRFELRMSSTPPSCQSPR